MKTENRNFKSIKVFVTKNYTFRAKVVELDGSRYEVSIGSESWNGGKGRQHEAVIMYKLKGIMNTLNKLNNTLQNGIKGSKKNSK